MSVKHVRHYYDEVREQYNDMLNELHDFEELAMQGMFEPERLDKIKESIQPLMRNYEVLSYIIFLLDKPNREKKSKDYLKRQQKTLSSIPDNCKRDGILQENAQVIHNLSDSKHS